MSGVMRITRRWVYSEMHDLAKETGIGLYLEEYSYRRKTQFKLLQVDDNGAAIKTLTDDYYTTREMYLALKAAREIYEAATNINPQSSDQAEKEAEGL